MPATKALIGILETVMEYAAASTQLTEYEKGKVVQNLHEICEIMDRLTQSFEK